MVPPSAPGPTRDCPRPHPARTLTLALLRSHFPFTPGVQSYLYTLPALELPVLLRPQPRSTSQCQSQFHSGPCMTLVLVSTVPRLPVFPSTLILTSVLGPTRTPVQSYSTVLLLSFGPQSCSGRNYSTQFLSNPSQSQLYPVPFLRLPVSNSTSTLIVPIRPLPLLFPQFQFLVVFRPQFSSSFP